MGIWQDRLRMMVQGWSTDVRIDRSGFSDPDIFGIGIWAKTWKWADRVAEVTLHAHGRVRLGEDPAPVLERTTARLLEGCLRARRDFPDSVPCQAMGLDDEGRLNLGTAERETDIAFRYPSRPFVPDLIHADPGAPESGAYAAALGNCAAHPDISYQDHLNPYAVRRMVRDEAPAEWQFEVRHAMRRFGGQIVKTRSFRNNGFATRTIDEETAAGLVSLSSASLARLFEAYGPGGSRHGATENGLPPGYEVYNPQPLRPAEDDEEPAP